MKIAGLQNLSLVDYPGKLAAAVFLQGCNFKCGYCQNPDLITFETEFSTTEEDVVEYITRRKDMLEGIVISGGEPTIHKDLPDLIIRIKELGMSIKLDTNGSNPDMLEELLCADLLNYVAIDIKTSLSKYGQLTDVKNIEELVLRSIYFTMLARLPYEFRITCVPGVVDEEDIRNIAKVVKGAAKVCLQQFSPMVTYDGSFKDIKPYERRVIQGFQKILEEAVDVVEIRGLK